MGHPDFRANGRIFATLHQDMLWGMVKLTPEQQQDFIRDDPDSFKPESRRVALADRPPSSSRPSATMRSVKR